MIGLKKYFGHSIDHSFGHGNVHSIDHSIGHAHGNGKLYIR